MLSKDLQTIKLVDFGLVSSAPRRNPSTETLATGGGKPIDNQDLRQRRVPLYIIQCSQDSLYGPAPHNCHG